MTTDRRDEMLKRGGRSPVWGDRRPLSVIMRDEVPYVKWEHQLAIIQRAGYDDHQQFLRAMYERKRR